MVVVFKLLPIAAQLLFGRRWSLNSRVIIAEFINVVVFHCCDGVIASHGVLAISICDNTFYHRSRCFIVLNRRRDGAFVSNIHLVRVFCWLFRTVSGLWRSLVSPRRGAFSNCYRLCELMKVIW